MANKSEKRAWDKRLPLVPKGSCAYKILTAMKMRDMDPEELSSMAGITLGSVYRYINHNVEPGQDALIKLARALGVETGVIIKDEGTPPLFPHSNQRRPVGESQSVESEEVETV